MHIDGFKEKLNSDLVDSKKFYRNIESILLEKRYMELYGMPINCFQCRKPMMIDGRKVLKTHRMPHTTLFCPECVKDNAKYHKDPMFIKHKNALLSFFKKVILDDSLEKLPNAIRELELGIVPTTDK